MKHTLTIALLALSTQAAAGPWLPVDLDDPTDAIAEAPPAEEQVVEIDLSSVRTALEDSIKQILQDRADPVQALPLPVEAVPETTVAELRGLLDGSAAHTARLDALLTRWIFFKGEVAVLEAKAVVRPDKRTSLLRLTVVDSPATPEHQALTLPGGLGVTWARAQSLLEQTVRGSRCDHLPLADDGMLTQLVPPPFLATTIQARNAAGPARQALCTAAGDRPWDRVELRPVEVHFNLYDRGGALRGGLELRAQPDGKTLAYPMFKRLPDAP